MSTWRLRPPPAGYCCECLVRRSELKVYAVGELCWACLYKVDPRK